MPEHHHGIDAEFAALAQPCVDEHGPQALALKRRQHGDWRQRGRCERSIRRDDWQPAEQDVADDAAMAFHYQRRDRVPIGSQLIHQIRFRRLAERLPVDGSNRRRIGWRLGSDVSLGRQWRGQAFYRGAARRVVRNSSFTQFCSTPCRR